MRCFIEIPGLVLVVWMTLAACAPARVSRGQDPEASLRVELERRYAENAAAFMRWDLQAIMALRAADFHTVTPQGVTNDRAAMERNTQGC